MRHISDNYDDGAYTKRDLTRLAIAAFRGSGPINVVPQVRSLDIHGGQATATVEVDFWADSTAREDAQHLVLQIELGKSSGKWQVIKAQGWHQAQDAF